jgi:cytochrome b6-f complex iron-sulfur subunit
VIIVQNGLIQKDSIYFYGSVKFDHIFIAMERRGFVRRISLTLVSVAGAVLGISFLRQFSHKRAGSSRRIKVGRLSDFPVDTYTFIGDAKVYIYRDHESVQAVSAICTHLGCTILHTMDGFECPCHGSCYADDGTVLSGPAPRALSWYRVERAPDGMILVDLDAVTAADEKFYIT